MKALHMISFVLVIVGAVNWALVGLMDENIVEMIFGASDIANIIYVLIGAAGVYIGATHMKDCKICSKK
jgi:uncharacterized protein